MRQQMRLQGLRSRPRLVVKRKDSGWRLTLPLSFARTLMLKTIIFAWKQGHAFDAPSHCMQKIIASRSAHSAQYANSNCTAHSAQSLLRSVRSHTHTHTLARRVAALGRMHGGARRLSALLELEHCLGPVSRSVRSVHPSAAQSVRQPLSPPEKSHTLLQAL